MPVTKVQKGNPNTPASESAENQQTIVAGPKQDFLQQLFGAYSNNTLDPETELYMNNVRKIIEDPSNKFQIITKKMPMPNGAVAFVTKKTGIIILFTAMCDIAVQDLKTGRRSEEAANSFRQMFPGLKLLNIIYVTKHDYACYTKMAAHIINYLQMSEDPNIDLFNIDTLRTKQLSVNIEKADALRFIQNTSPHGILPRADFGFVLSISPKNESFFEAQRQETPILAVVGYTEFVEAHGDMSVNQKFNPIIHISDISCAIPTPKMLSLAIPVAAWVFVSAGLWKQSYAALKKSEPHIGNLISDPTTTKPWFAETQAALGSFIANYMNFPMLVMDIPEGRARLPYTEKFLFEANHPEIIAEFESFLNCKFSGPMSLGNIKYSEIIGTVKAAVAGGYMDSRCMDYLYLIMTSGPDPKFEEFRVRFENVDQRCNSIASLTEFEKTNLNTVFQFNPMFVKEAGSEIIKRNLRFNNPAQSTIPTVSFDNTMGTLSGFNFMSPGGFGTPGSTSNIYG